jgi:uncharacterized protein YyaL (SSP411 family)
LNDKARRARGVPRVDRHIYARENGWAINALATLAGVTGDVTMLRDAIRAAEWIIVHRSLGKGGFRHDEKDASGPYFGDSVYMARAFLTLYEVTADREWLQHAQATARFASERFRSDAGYLAFTGSLGRNFRRKLRRTRTRLSPGSQIC